MSLTGEQHFLARHPSRRRLGRNDRDSHVRLDLVLCLAHSLGHRHDRPELSAGVLLVPGRVQSHGARNAERRRRFRGDRHRRRRRLRLHQHFSTSEFDPFAAGPDASHGHLCRQSNFLHVVYDRRCLWSKHLFFSTLVTTTTTTTVIAFFGCSCSVVDFDVHDNLCGLCRQNIYNVVT